MDRKKIIQLVLYTFSPLFLGVLIYVASRSNSIYFLSLFSLNNEKIHLPDLIKFNVVDGLWAFSASTLLQIIWDWELKKSLVFWFFILVFTSIYFEVNYGTYDSKDVVLITIGLFTPLTFTMLNNLKTIKYEQKNY